MSGIGTSIRTVPVSVSLESTLRATASAGGVYAEILESDLHSTEPSARVCAGNGVISASIRLADKARRKHDFLANGVFDHA
jgi:hypothetical protein